MAYDQNIHGNIGKRPTDTRRMLRTPDSASSKPEYIKVFVCFLGPVARSY